MAERQPALLTVKEYRSLPETAPRCQLIEGEFVVAPAPNRYHQEISRNLLYVLLRFLEQNPVGELFNAPFDVYLGQHNVFQPDLVFVARDRSSILTEEGADGGPTLIVEILSPSTALHDRTVKKNLFARHGVDELWFVDPEERTIELYRLQEDPDRSTRVFEESDQLTSICFPGLQISVARIFRREFGG